jgi:tRNA (guanine-N7-)-methyltransferase
VGRNNKLRRFSEILSYKNVVENYDYRNPVLTWDAGKTVDFKGRWIYDFFKKPLPLTLELACGRGEYTIGMAQHYPERNFLGVDIKGARIWKGSSNANELKLTNAGFLRTRIEQINLFFDPEEVDEIWITFPDPFLLKERNRLTHHRFLDLYLSIIKKGGYIHLKTDDMTLYEYTLESIAAWGHGEIIYQTKDVYQGEMYDEVLNIKTHYEALNISRGNGIKYIKFRIKN